PRVAGRLDGDRVLREPALEGRAELEDREEQGNEHDEHERRLEGREPGLVGVEAAQWTVCICATSAWSRATRPLVQAETPMPSVPSTTAAPMMYSIVASPSDEPLKERSRMANLPLWWRETRPRATGARWSGRL